MERCRIKGDIKGVNRCLSELSKIKATYALDKASIKEKNASATVWADSIQASDSEEKIKEGGDISKIAELLKRWICAGDFEISRPVAGLPVAKERAVFSGQAAG